MDEFLVEMRAVMDWSAIIISDQIDSRGGHLCQTACPATELQCWHKRNQTIKGNLLEMGF